MTVLCAVWSDAADCVSVHHNVVIAVSIPASRKGGRCAVPRSSSFHACVAAYTQSEITWG